MYLSVYLVFNPSPTDFYIFLVIFPPTEFYSAMRKKNIIISIGKWVEPEILTWNEIKDKHLMFSFLHGIKSHYFSLSRTDFQKCYHKICHSSFIHRQIKWSMNTHIMLFIKIVHATSDFYCYDQIVETNNLKWWKTYFSLTCKGLFGSVDLRPERRKYLRLKQVTKINK